MISNLPEAKEEGNEGEIKAQLIEEILEKRKISDIDKEDKNAFLNLIAYKSGMQFEIKRDSGQNFFSDVYISYYTKDELIKINELFSIYQTTEDILKEINSLIIKNKYNLIKKENEIVLVLTIPLKICKQIIIPIKKYEPNKKDQLGMIINCLKNINQKIINIEKGKDSSLNEKKINQINQIIEK